MLPFRGRQSKRRSCVPDAEAHNTAALYRGTHMIRPIAACIVLLGVSVIAFAEEKPMLKAPVGLQLYSLRAQFQAEGVPKTLDRVKDLWFKYVELAGTYNLAPDKFKAMLDERGLTPIAGHFAFDRFKSDP